MLKKSDSFYLGFEEPTSSCLLALKIFILSANEHISVEIKWGMPSFLFQNKMICYLWVDKKKTNPYIGFMDGNKMKHPDLELGNRKRIKIYPVKPDEDLAINTIRELINEAIELKKT